MLTSSLDQYRTQQKISALALRQARRTATRGATAVAAVVTTYQLESASLTFGSTPEVLAEQGLDAPTSGSASLSAILTAPNVTAGMLDATATSSAFDSLILALVQDAGRTAAVVDIGRRLAITGYVRSLNPPSCGRCAVLAGRVYRYSTGFQRHPRCDCLMTPTNDAEGLDLITDPSDLISNGQIRGLSKGDIDALDGGADLSQIVNVRRKQSGLVVGSSVIERGGRLTPQGIMRVASDRPQVVALLKQNGYIV